MKKPIKTQVRAVLPVPLVEELIVKKEETELGLSVLIERAVAYALKHPEVFEW